MDDYLSGTIKVFSFDVFDTVIVRKVLEPKGIFTLMQRRLAGAQTAMNKSLVDDFVRLRIGAELAARRDSLREEVTLDEIYDALGMQFGLTPEEGSYLRSLEIEVEIDSVNGVPQTINLIRRLRREGKRVVFVSDMYLPREVIETMLATSGAFQQGDGLYLSCESSATKETGNLFRLMIEKEQCDPNQIVHTGDNVASDILSARALGIKAVPFDAVAMNRLEAIWCWQESSSVNGNVAWQLIGGAARNARLSLSNESSSMDTLQRIGAEVAGPVLAGFVLWVLEEARRLGLKRLYFLARDGQILLDIANEFAKRQGLQLELRYLYGSRQAWHLPAMSDTIGECELEWMFEADPTLTLNILSNRTDVDLSTFQDVLSRLGKHLDADHSLSEGEIDFLRRAMCETELGDKVLHQARKKRKIALEYFRQQGLRDAPKFGIVDLGWQGRMQDSLRRILSDESCGFEIHGFYFGLCRKAGKDDRHNQKRAFFFYPGCGEPFWSIGNWFANFLEIFTAADHGLTTCYQMDRQGTCTPKLAAETNLGAMAWGLEEMRRGIHEFIRFFPEEITEEPEPFREQYRDRMATLMRTFLTLPETDHAEAIGRYPFSSDQAETYFRPFAPPFAAATALRYSLTADPMVKIALTYWLEGTRTCSPSLARIILSPLAQRVFVRLNGMIARLRKMCAGK